MIKPNFSLSKQGRKASVDSDNSKVQTRRTSSQRSTGVATSQQSEETVKFEFDQLFPEMPEVESGTITPGSVSQAQIVIKDETLMLFDCMPKGLESFLETGPSRKVVDYMDYEKLCATQKKKIEYLKEQEVPHIIRSRDIQEKSLELQEHFKNFDLFITEAQKKRDRAASYFISCKNANRDLDIEIPRAAKRLEEFKEVRDVLLAKVIKYQPVDDFIESVLKVKDSQFLNFNAIQGRNITLQSTNKYLTRRFTERHNVEKKLSEELQSIKNVTKTHDIFLRREINRLKKVLQQLARENLDLEQKCTEWSEMTKDNLMTVFLMTDSIKNLGRMIMQVRPFTAKRLEGVTNPCEIIEMVGIFIRNYSDIVNGIFVLPKSKPIKDKEKERKSSEF